MFFPSSKNDHLYFQKNFDKAEISAHLKELALGEIAHIYALRGDPMDSNFTIRRTQEGTYTMQIAPHTFKDADSAVNALIERLDLKENKTRIQFEIYKDLDIRPQSPTLR